MSLDDKMIEALRNGIVIVSESKNEESGMFRWVAVYPAKPRFTITSFELETTYIENEWDVDESDLKKKIDFNVNTMDEVIKMLTELEVDLSTMTYCWKTDYPI